MRWRRVLLGGEGAIGGGLEVAAHGPSASARLAGQEASANRGAGEEQAAGAVVTHEVAVPSNPVAEDLSHLVSLMRASEAHAVQVKEQSVSCKTGTTSTS
ncbi:Os12g0630750 [Oryza sativa Japonica Group]|uniref:Os12g0630750 protein n=1 Tax=Oryza sativa subsp. japonica TaxID=39947 RepID=C7J9E5_ORYSJ|nr:Os12g0630750 [Oryza sativa Japonica Group]|eukprot:NP_001177072.1 Os12g0630750 [Oryza sativa Japonica Group]